VEYSELPTHLIAASAVCSGWEIFNYVELGAIRELLEVEMDISRIENGSPPKPAENTTAQPSAVVAQRSKLATAMQAINASNILGADNELTYVIDRATSMMAFRVIDRATHQVVAQLPPESVLRLAQELQGKGKTTPG